MSYQLLPYQHDSSTSHAPPPLSPGIKVLSRAFIWACPILIKFHSPLRIMFFFKVVVKVARFFSLSHSLAADVGAYSYPLSIYSYGNPRKDYDPNGPIHMTAPLTQLVSNYHSLSHIC